MKDIRFPTVAGRFYPASPDHLRSALEEFFQSANPVSAHPKAIVVPHAGYVYSGSIAASGYACLSPAQRQIIRRVILLGTAHSRGIEGLVTSNAEEFATPLGNVPLDQHAITQALRFPQVSVNEDAHHYDHAIEVQLPFLQTMLEDFAIVPFLVGRAKAQEVADVLEALWGGEDTLFVLSTDLSHYLTYEDARELDLATSQAIERLDPEAMQRSQACGYYALRGLLTCARQHGMRARVIDLRNSGDMVGPRDEVVGYGAFILEEPAQQQSTNDKQQAIKESPDEIQPTRTK